MRALVDETALATRARALGEVLRAAAADATLLLHGPMGAGKTTFTRALAGGLGVARPDRVCSPTFTLCAVHRGPVALIHVDLFRLADGDDPGMGGEAAFDALAGAWDDETGDLAGPRVTVVEWAARWRSPPDDRLELRLSYHHGDAAADPLRLLEAAATGPRSAELLAAWTARLL